jgi:hypothetical protein
MKIRCENFKPLRKNTLVGFAEILIEDIGLRVKGLSIHEKGRSRWASLPAKPQTSKDGMVIKDAGGKAQYVHILEFDSRERSDGFSAAVITAVLAIAPNTFEHEDSF